MVFDLGDYFVSFCFIQKPHNVIELSNVFINSMGI
jgi:hypothetical protein